MEKQKQPLLSIAKREALPWYKNWLIRGGAILLALVFLVGLGVLLISVIAGGFAAAKKRRSWETVCLLTVTVWGALLFLICCSSMAFAPVLWCCAGGTVAALAKKDRA